MNSRNDELCVVKEERDRLLEDVNAYKRELEKLGKTLLEKEVATKTMTRSVVGLKGP